MFPRIPYMIVGLIAGSVLSVLLNHFLYAQDPGAGVQVMGGIPGTLPPLSSPDFSLATIKQLAPAAFAMTLLALTEAVTIARSLAARRGHPVDGNQEFIGQGLSNIIGSFFSAYVATGSFNRSALNFEAGAKTPVAAAIAGDLTDSLGDRHRAAVGVFAKGRDGRNLVCRRLDTGGFQCHRQDCARQPCRVGGALGDLLRHLVLPPRVRDLAWRVFVLGHLLAAGIQASGSW